MVRKLTEIEIAAGVVPTFALHMSAFGSKADIAFR